MTPDFYLGSVNYRTGVLERVREGLPRGVCVYVCVCNVYYVGLCGRQRIGCEDHIASSMTDVHGSPGKGKVVTVLSKWSYS